MDVLNSYSQMAKELGITPCYAILPAISINDVEMFNYWIELERADTIKYRWPDMNKPATVHIIDWIRNCGLEYQSFYVMDCTTGALVSEFALSNFSGRSAQVHFSMMPGLDSRIAVQLADYVTDTVLLNWEQMSDLGPAYLDSLYGLTPVENRVACIFVLKSGFKKIGILPSGSHYFGGVCDAMLTIKEGISYEREK